MRQEMDEQPEVLQRIADSAAEIRDRVRAVVPEALDGIAFVGRGSSDNAAMLGRYASSPLTGRPGSPPRACIRDMPRRSTTAGTSSSG
jgi:glucosamine--fructose-6-phosphate aminotransferase (isomerizing)